MTREACFHRVFDGKSQIDLGKPPTYRLSPGFIDLPFPPSMNDAGRYVQYADSSRLVPSEKDLLYLTRGRQTSLHAIIWPTMIGRLIIVTKFVMTFQS